MADRAIQQDAEFYAEIPDHLTDDGWRCSRMRSGFRDFGRSPYAEAEYILTGGLYPPQAITGSGANRDEARERAIDRMQAVMKMLRDDE